jgi:oligoendopeptidase F
MFAEMGRFDYDVKACEQFHEAIKSEVIPLVQKIHQKRKQQLNVENLYPYDLEVDAENLPALKPFTTQEELIEKSVKCLDEVDSFFAECIPL